METVAWSIEMETKAGGAMIETMAGYNESKMDVVDIDVGTGMYTKIFTHKKKKLDKTYQQTDALMRDKGF